MILTNTLKNKGFTLVEVILALFIMAMIAMLSAQAFNTAASSSDATREAMKRIAEVDGTFVLIEADLRNAIPKVFVDHFGTALPALLVDKGSDYWMTIMRGGLELLATSKKSEEVRIGYRFVDDEIWRDTWYNPRLTDQRDAKPKKILSDVKSIKVRILPPPPIATSLAAGPWLDRWPQGQPDILPLAIEVTLVLDDMGEVMRLFSILPGKGPPLSGGSNPGIPGTPGNGASSSGGPVPGGINIPGGTGNPNEVRSSEQD